ncbi:MAG: hypothetical protein K2F58_02395 [Muribaculaceae bacterium]|nr:hypothetical protein [Muribaculaceae bacterium]
MWTGNVRAAFKVRVNKLSGIEQVFANGFNDQILKPGRSLDAIYRYLRGNPGRHFSLPLILVPEFSL